MTFWAIIDWLPDYEFSDDAQVRSYKKGGVRLLSTAKTDPAGYHQLGLFVDGRRRYFRLHKLIALAWFGEPPEGQETCHWDGDKDNNGLFNLYYGTRQQNILDQVRHGRHVNARKTQCINGHEFDVNPRGGRVCRECARRKARDWRERNKIGV
jgi:hypothetical protein